MTDKTIETKSYEEFLLSDKEVSEALMEAEAHVDDAYAALIAVIEQWGPITFADETIEANKKKQIQITRENGFVKFSVEKPDSVAIEWPDETRIDIIGSNGNDGEHYAQD